jgi:hypothetical protein
MKKWFEKNGLITGIALILVVVFAVGGFFTDYVVTQRGDEITVDAERYKDAVVLIDLEYNLDSETLGHKAYIVTFTYEGSTYKAFLDNTFTYVEMIEGDSLDLIVLSAVKHHAEQDALLQNKAYIVSYNETTKTLVMAADGFAGSGSISIEFILNDDLNAVVSYLVTSNETYKSEYNTKYTDGVVPFVENTFMDLYLDGQVIATDAVAGASEGTGVAMQELITLLDLFLDSMEGGN